MDFGNALGEGVLIPDQHEALLQHWMFTVDATTHTVVLPDGCRDLIIQVLPDGRKLVMVSDVDTVAYQAEAAVGVQFIGYRFRPAAVVDAPKLLRAVGGMKYADVFDVLDVIDACVQVDWRLDEALGSLQEGQTVASASAFLGVSERTVERLVKARTGFSPVFWRSLARVRKAAKVIKAYTAHKDSLNRACDVRYMSMSDIAAECGYADQAHMNREFRRWFGVSPGVFQSQAQWLNALFPGYG